MFYMGFNMLDRPAANPTASVRASCQALSIAVDQEEFISIFMNGRGIAAMSPVPPGIFGHGDGAAGINPVVTTGKAMRRTAPPQPIAVAEKLLAEAGWPNGRDAGTNEPARAHLDTTGGGMGDKSTMDWLTRQFAKLDIQLVVRRPMATAFRKNAQGARQIFFFRLERRLPGPGELLLPALRQRRQGGERRRNAANYANPEFDRLFAEMKMEAMDERRSPRGRSSAHEPHPAGRRAVDLRLPSQKLHAGARLAAKPKPMGVGNNALKYQRIDVAERERQRRRGISRRCSGRWR